MIIDKSHWSTGQWKVLRLATDNGRWRVALETGDEAVARAEFDRLSSGLRRGLVRLLTPGGQVAADAEPRDTGHAVDGERSE